MLKVGIFFGGKSIEREVSFNSGRTICDHLDTQYFKAIPIFQTAAGDLYILPWAFLYRGKIADFEHRLDKEAQKIVWDDLPLLVDFMYIAVHGKYGEDGRLQAMLELFKIPYLGTKVFGTALAMNKVLHNDFLQHYVDVPRGFFLHPWQIKQYNIDYVKQCMLEKNLHFPVIVKPSHEGSSFGVFVAKDEQTLQKAIYEACFISDDIGQEVLVEEKIVGMEFTCIIITDYKTGNLIPLPPTEIIVPKHAQIFDYEQKYMPGRAIERTPASCDIQKIKKIQETCLKAMKALEFSNMARIDGFLTPDNRVVIIDSNPLSGMAPATFLFRQAGEYGMGHAELINCLIKAELKNYNMEKEVKLKKQLTKMKIAVLFGGATEKEVSFDSGRNVCYKLSPDTYEVIPIFVDDTMKLHVLDKRLLGHASTHELVGHLSDAKLIQWSDLKTMVDFVFLALHGGQGENGVVQGVLEMLGVSYNGSSIFASALCNDKFKTTQFLAKKGIAVPKGFLLTIEQWRKNKTKTIQEIVKTVGYPCIIKPHDDGCSVLVSVAYNEKELQQNIATIFESKKQHVLIEERIIGMELTVGVIGNDSVRALMPSETIVHKDVLSIEEKFLPGMGENQTPARLSKENINFVKNQVEQIYTVIGCTGCARIDCFFQTAEQSPTGTKRVVIIEINTLPALTPATCLFHQAAEEGLRPMQLLDEIIQLGLQKHQQAKIIDVDKVLHKQQLFEKENA